MKTKKIFLAKLTKKIKSDDYIKYILSTYYSYDFDEIDIKRTSNKKPYIKNIHYSVSHKGSYIVAIVSDSEIGIDMEIVDDNYREKIVDKYFSKSERDYILSHNDEKNVKFFEVWTKKEAYIKKMNLTLADIKKIDTSNENIFTFRLSDIIISVCE